MSSCRVANCQSDSNLVCFFFPPFLFFFLFSSYPGGGGLWCGRIEDRLQYAEGGLCVEDATLLKHLSNVCKEKGPGLAPQSGIFFVRLDPSFLFRKCCVFSPPNRVSLLQVPRKFELVGTRHTDTGSSMQTRVDSPKAKRTAFKGADGCFSGRAAFLSRFN